MERKLLTYYHERVYRFNNDHVDNSSLWKEIVQVSRPTVGHFKYTVEPLYNVSLLMEFELASLKC